MKSLAIIPGPWTAGAITQRRLIVPILALVLSVNCAGPGRLSLRSSPYEEYAAMLHDAGLDKTALGREWTAAGVSALRSAAPVASPFTESGYFAAEEPTAVAYGLALERGRRLLIEVRFDTVEPGRLFVDLFRREADGGLRLVASLDDSTMLVDHVVDRSATYVIRLQPELLRSGRFTLTQNTRATLRTFPASGVTARAVQSGFGARRDNGTRAHEGIDIFAPRGTPVLAVTDGIAHRSTNVLGGNVVWLRDGLLGATRYYYAHLDRWAIEGSASVREGDVLGYVGNTGNARTTSPHLHFGIYSDGALDPAPFLAADEQVPAVVVDPALLGTLVRSRSRVTSLTAGPADASAERALLAPNTLARRLGVSGMWRRLRLPDGTEGYIRSNAIGSVSTALGRRALIEPSPLREKPLVTAAVITTLERGADVEVLGHFPPFDYVRSRTRLFGWIESRH